MEISLNGRWFYHDDPLEQGLKRKWFKIEILRKNKELKEVTLPKCWNIIEENGNLIYAKYESVMWFTREFETENIDDKFDYFLYFNGANYISKLWINETYLGMNEG